MVDKRYYGPAKGRSDVNIYTISWINPYGSEHRIKAQPQLTHDQRLASVMRVIGHPLTIMRNWPEVVALQNGGSETTERSDKAMSMAEQKAVAAHRAALEKSIEKLSARRDIVKAELDVLEEELKRLLLMHKAAGPAPGEEDPLDPTESKPKKKGPKEKAQKAYGKKLKAMNGTATGPSSIAIKLASKGAVTPTILAEAAGIDAISASNYLGKLAREGTITRVSRGVYGAA